MANEDSLLSNISKETVTKIYADWKWELRKNAHTPVELSKSIDACIEKIRTDVPDETVRNEAIDMFRRGKLQAASLTTDPSCYKCGTIFGEDDEKVWVEDGKYECLKCK